MSQSKLKNMATAQLVERFTEIGIAQDEAELGLETAEFNRLFKEMVAIEEELKARDGDQRRILLQLFGHPNMQVRLNAAKASLAVAPSEARQALRAIKATRWQPQAGDAGMCLWNLDRGIFKPM